MAATFKAVPGAVVKIGDSVQKSGVTVNDFRGPVVYTVTAADGKTSVYYTVNILTTIDPQAVSWAKLSAAGVGVYHDIAAAANNTYIVAAAGSLLEWKQAPAPIASVVASPAVRAFQAPFGELSLDAFAVAAPTHPPEWMAATLFAVWICGLTVISVRRATQCPLAAVPPPASRSSSEGRPAWCSTCTARPGQHRIRPSR